MRSIVFIRSIGAALIIAGLYWPALIGVSTPRPVIVERLIAGRPVAVQELGRGPDVLIISDARDVSVLASRLAHTHRVVIVPAAHLAQALRLDLRGTLDRLEVAGDVLVVAAVAAVLPILEGAAVASGRLIRIAALDVDRASSHGAEIDRLLATTSSNVFAFTSPSGLLWSRYRAKHPNRRIHLSLIEACDGGFTTTCMNELAPFVGGLTHEPPTPGTGTVLQDPMDAIRLAVPMVVVPNGQFRAGQTSDQPRALSAAVSRSVRVPRRLAVARTETTVSAFRRFVESTGYQAGKGCWYHTIEQEWKLDEQAAWSAPGFIQAEDHPVTCVTYADAHAYATWVSEQTGRAYRLPTEAEFEFINRSGRMGTYGFEVRSIDELCDRANGADQATSLPYANRCDDGFSETAPVGSFAPNDFGLSDATGNLWELTTDCWRSDAMTALWNLLGRAPAEPPVPVTGSCSGWHVLRGGSFLSSPNNLRVVQRDRDGYRSTRVGFRIVRDLP